MIRSKIEEGTLQPGMTLLDASSGNMACSIAFYGKLLGYPAEVVANSKLTDDKRKFPFLGVVKKNAPHYLSRYREKMRSVLPPCSLLINKLQVGLVYQSGRLKRMTRIFLTHEKAPELSFNKRY